MLVWDKLVLMDPEGKKRSSQVSAFHLQKIFLTVKFEKKTELVFPPVSNAVNFNEIDVFIHS